MSIELRSDDVEMDLFNEYFDHNSEICNNCFNRWRESFHPTHSVEKDGWAEPLRQSLQEIIVKRHFSNTERSEEFHHHDITDGSGSTCECGSPFSKIRPMTMKQAIECGHNIVAELDRRGISYDGDAFYDTVRRLKRNPNWQGNEDEIFARALNVAVRRP